MTHSLHRVLWTAASMGAGVFVLGVPMHDFFDFVGGAPAAGLIGPVNESAWEHFNMFF